jgi:hypothetical protein
MSVTTTKASVPAVSATMGGSVMVPQNMDQAIRLAEMLSKSKNAVPGHFLGDPGACLLALDQAMRWGMSPFAVMQATFVYQGKLGYEGKLVAAAVESSNAIVGLMQYRFEGAGDGLKVICSAVRRGETEPKEAEAVLSSARTSNDHWKKSPDQMLIYHVARKWARRWTPGVILGVYTREEIDSGEAFEGATIDGAATQIVDTGEAAGTRDAMNASVPLKDKPEWLDRVDATERKLEATERGPECIEVVEKALEVAQSDGEVAAIHGLPKVQVLLKKAPAEPRAALQAKFAAAFKRVQAGVETGPEFDGDIPDVVIPGEEYRNA